MTLMLNLPLTWNVCCNALGNRSHLPTSPNNYCHIPSASKFWIQECAPGAAVPFNSKADKFSCTSSSSKFTEQRKRTDSGSFGASGSGIPPRATQGLILALGGKTKNQRSRGPIFLGQDSPNIRHHAFAWWWATSFCGSHVLCVFWTPRTPSQLFYVRFQSFNLLWAVSEDQQPQAAAPAIASCGLVRFSTNPMSGSNIGVLSIWPTCVSCLIREYQMHLNM